MKFNTLDSLMRKYEEALDQDLPPQIWPVVRLDGRSFSNLTAKMKFKRPFDMRFRDAMIATAKHVMQCGFQSIYAYVTSDEISILFSKDDNTFNRQMRKWLSVLAGEASAIFTHTLQMPAAFDARIVPLSSQEVIFDYFRWRQGDSGRNSINGYCYWKLRDAGHTDRKATKILERMPLEQKLLLLKQYSINHKEIPRWERFGIGVSWETIDKEGFNPITQEKVMTKRRVLLENLDLPVQDSYAEYLKNLFEGK